MADKGSSFTSLGVLGVLAAILFGATRPAPVSDRPADQRASDRDSVRYREASGSALFGPGNDSGPFTNLRTSLRTWRADSLKPLDVLIATVPDPIDSRGDWSFDAALQSLQRAHERAGFVIDQFWLPWTFDREQLERHVPSEQRPNLRLSTPGVILFRNTRPRNDSMRVVLVVGEVPTSGVHVHALETALSAREELLRESHAPGSAVDTVRMVAPFYSGSAKSIRSTLDIWNGRPRAPGRMFDLISGSATSPGLDVVLTAPASRRPLRIRFRTTVRSDGDMRRALGELLRRMHVDYGAVAELAEGTTDYGRGTLNSGFARMLRIRVPIGIASLRTAYERRSKNQPQPEVPGRQAAPFSLSLEDPDQPTEQPSVFSTRLTPAALDEMIDATAQLMRARGIKVVGLQMTDVRDKLFLAQEVRRRLPGVQLFTYESNVLFTWPAYQDALSGMLVLTTYPLVPEVQLWTRRRPALEVMPFSSNPAEGVYNATLEQLRKKNAFEDYMRPDSGGGQPPVWVTEVGRHSLVPLWMWTPDSTLADPTLLRALRLDPQRQRPSPTPFLYFLFGLGEVVLCAALASWLWLDRKPGRIKSLEEEIRTGSAWYERTMMQRSESATESDAKRVAATVHGFTLLQQWGLYAGIRALALGGVAVAAATLLWATARFPSFLGAALPPSLIATLLVIYHAGQLYRSESEWGEPGRDFLFRPGRHAWGERADRVSWRLEFAARWAVGLGSLALGGLVVWLILAYGVLGGLEEQLLRLRVARLGSGLSPLFPLAIGAAGATLWSSWHLQRVKLLAGTLAFEGWAMQQASYEPRLERPDPDGPGNAKEAGEVASVRLRLFLVSYGWGNWVLLLAVGFVAAILVFDVNATAESAAVPGSRIPLLLILRVLVAASFAGLAWGAIRLFSVWRAFHRVLVSVCASPLLSAFERLPSRIAAMARFTLVGSTQRPDIGVVADTMWHHLTGLWRFARSEATTLRDHHGAAWDDAEQLMAIERPPTLKARGVLIETRATDYGRLRKVLHACWALEPDGPDVEALRVIASGDLGTARDPGLEVSTTGRLRRVATTRERLWLRALEEFVALHFVEYAECVIEHLRLMAGFLVCGLVLALLLVSSYPAYQDRSLQYACFVVLLLSMGMLVSVLVQISRDEVLSRIAKTDPGSVTWDARFIFSLATFVGVPLMAVLTSVFPAIRDFLFAWINPVLHSMPH